MVSSYPAQHAAGNRLLAMTSRLDDQTARPIRATRD